jgi:hypothetical protein
MCRKAATFIVAGFNAYPAEIELALAEHEGVSDAAVVGVPDTRLGEVGTAFIVPARDARLTTEDLTEWSRLRLANYKVPRSGPWAARSGWRMRCSASGTGRSGHRHMSLFPSSAGLNTGPVSIVIGRAER